MSNNKKFNGCGYNYNYSSDYIWSKSSIMNKLEKYTGSGYSRSSKPIPEWLEREIRRSNMTEEEKKLYDLMCVFNSFIKVAEKHQWDTETIIEKFDYFISGSKDE